jgi:hypothetical protein
MSFQIFPYVVLLAIVAGSVVVGGVIGGWRAMAERYPALAVAPLNEERYRFASMRSGWGLFWSSYFGNCVTVGVSSRGLSLAVWAPFSLFHPPLFIPWEALEKCRRIEHYRQGPWTLVTLREGGDFTVTGQAAEAVFRYAAERGLAEGVAQPAHAADKPDGRGPPRGLKMARSGLIEQWAMTCRRFAFGAAVTALVAIVLLAYANHVDNSERAAQRDAEAHGVIVPAVVKGRSLNTRQSWVTVLVVVQGVERTTTVFKDEPLKRGTSVQVAWAPADPTRIYIVGARPWTRWAVTRPLFRAIAGISVLVALAGLLLNLRSARE